MAKDYLDSGNSEGTSVGQSASSKAGFHNAASVQSSALTAQLTTITFTEPGTPDYAIQAPTNSSPYGFVTADEARSVLKVIANLQTRLAEVEAALEAKGIVAAN